MPAKNSITLPEEKPPHEIAQLVLAGIEKDAKPRTIRDAVIVHGGVRNAFQLAIVVRIVRNALRADGSHYYLTEQKKWAFTTEKWAEEAGLEKAKPVELFDPAIRAVEETRLRIQEGQDNNLVPEQFAKHSNAVLDIMTQRAAKKLDKASVDLSVESMSAMVETTEELAKDNQRLAERVEDLKAHLAHERKTKDELLEVLKNLSAGGMPLPTAAE